MEIEPPDYCLPRVSMMLNDVLMAMCESMALSSQVIPKYLLVPSLANKSKDKLNPFVKKSKNTYSMSTTY
jgi:hypothetical protein